MRFFRRRSGGAGGQARVGGAAQAGSAWRRQPPSRQGFRRSCSTATRTRTGRSRPLLKAAVEVQARPSLSDQRPRPGRSARQAPRGGAGQRALGDRLRRAAAGRRSCLLWPHLPTGGAGADLRDLSPGRPTTQLSVARDPGRQDAAPRPAGWRTPRRAPDCYLCNPNNPTGSIVPTKDIAATIDRLQGRSPRR